MFVPLDEPCAEAVAEQMPPAAVLVVERLGVDSVQALHAGGELLACRRDDQVVVVRHQAEHLAAPLVAVDARVEQTQEPEVVVIVEVDRAALDPTGGDVEGSVSG